jgi:hypothetical protein
LRIAPCVNGVGTGPSPVLQEHSPLSAGPRPATSTSNSWRRNVTFKAMGWGLKDTCDQLKLLPGDRVDIAYNLGMNDHPEFGGLELTVRDLVKTSLQP